MIPGDIDLTENLDFRKVVRKQIPQLPDVFKGKFKINTEIDNRSYISIANDGDLYINLDATSMPTSISMTNTTYTSTNYTISYNTCGIDNITSSSFSRNYTSFEMSDTIYYTFNKPNGGYIYLKSEPKYDIFGNEIKPVKEIPNIPWNDRKRNNSIPSIPLERGRNFSLRRSEWEDYDIIPWQIDYNKPKIDLYSKVGRAKHLISWFSNKSSSYINNYFNSDDNLRYLTDMSWIRVKDAVID